ncbi:MAG: hypothetical protein ACKOW9_03450 [Candidatus Paceibacterota bacterium]
MSYKRVAIALPYKFSTVITMSSIENIIGNVYIPSGAGVQVGKFEFVLDDDQSEKTQIGDTVTAITTDGNFIGVVTDMRTVGVDNDPVTSKIKKQSIARLPEVVVAEAQVIHSEKIRSVRDGFVRPANKEEIKEATGFFKINWPIPAGLVQISGNELAPVYFDGHTLLGPESAHFNIGGLSGQAAKTSYMTFLLASAIQSSTAEEKVASLVFNVKGEDLIWLDKSPTRDNSLEEDDLKLYRELELTPTPFTDVTVYSPALPAKISGTRSPREDSHPIVWDLNDVWPYLRHYLGNIVYEDEKIASFIADFTVKMLQNHDKNKRVDTFAKLEKWFNAVLSTDDDNETPYVWGTHHRATLWRIRRMLMGIVTRSQGLVTLEKSNNNDDVPVKNWRAGQVIVVDIAGLSLDIQSVVIARTVDRVLKAAETSTLGVNHLVLIADELNAFAPASGGDMQVVKRSLQKVSTQGRYAGLSLWGAAQKLSKVDDMVRDNAATRALGRNSDGELTSSLFSKMSRGIHERIVSLPKGFMSLSHYTFRTEMIVKFPKPAWKMGRSTEHPTRNGIEILNLSPETSSRLSEGLTDDEINTIMSSSKTKKEAIEKLSKSRVPDMKKRALHQPYSFNPSNPFDIS